MQIPRKWASTVICAFCISSSQFDRRFYEFDSVNNIYDIYKENVLALRNVSRVKLLHRKEDLWRH